MYTRWLGLILLLISLIIGALIVAHVKITVFNRQEDYVQAIENGQVTPVIDRVVEVPPWNHTTEGWVGFDIILQQEKVNYEAFGGVIPNDNDKSPDIAMRVVNKTGLAQLVFDQFNPATWDGIKTYAAADLYPPENLYAQFRFRDLDDVYPKSTYTVLFRGYKNETGYRPILVNIKEAWSEATEVPLLEPTALNIAVSAMVGVFGVGLVIRKPRPLRKRPVQKRSFSR